MENAKKMLIIILLLMMVGSNIFPECKFDVDKMVIDNSLYLKNVTRKPITYDYLLQLDLRNPCGFTAEQLRIALPASMKDLAGTYIIQEKDGMNALFKAAMDALESHNATKCFKPNNISGWFTDRNFKSKEECILYVGSKIRRWYLTEPIKEHYSDVGKYYKGYTISDVVYYYSPKTNGELNVEYIHTVTSIVYNWIRIIEDSSLKN